VAPGNPRARLDRSLALASLGRLEEAAQALAGVPGAAEEPRLAPGAVRVSRLLQRQVVCEWSTRVAAIEEVRRALDDPARRTALAEPGMVMNALGLPLSAAEQRRLGEAAFVPARHEGARIAASAPPLAPGANGARLRVGFFAAGLRVHPESYLIRRLFTDRDRATMEYVLYALNPDDGSALRADIARAADRFVDASGWDCAALLRAARTERLDLAVDLSSGYAHGRPEIFAARVAPVQVAYLAAPCNLGPGLHDYRITDPWTTPPAAQGNWDARLAPVAPSPFVYDDSIPPQPAGTRGDHGLAGGFVFTCMNQPFKIDPDCFDVWMRLLGRVDGSTLWLLDPGVPAKANLVREAQALGVSAARLVFAPALPLAQHLGRLAHADLFLDTFHCNAHTTALDALGAGLPVLTRTGATMASRLAGAFVRGAGLPELAVESTADYEAMALRLAADRPALEAIKARLRQARSASPLFDTAGRVRAMERAFREMAGR
jgi:predicted O-linked N-acetylglucosamine transferase (SPINDLY family)